MVLNVCLIYQLICLDATTGWIIVMSAKGLRDYVALALLKAAVQNRNERTGNVTVLAQSYGVLWSFGPF